jgi:hypothetical protein
LTSLNNLPVTYSAFCFEESIKEVNEKSSDIQEQVAEAKHQITEIKEGLKYKIAKLTMCKKFRYS